MRGLQEDLRVELLHHTRLAFAKEFVVEAEGNGMFGSPSQRRGQRWRKGYTYPSCLTSGRIPI